MTVEEKTGASGAYSAFAFRDFRYWIAYRYLSGVALQMRAVAVGWYLYELTGSAVALGIAGLASFLPSLMFALVTGHVADTYNRRWVVVIAFSICGATMLALTLAIVAGSPPLWLIYLAVAVIGVSRSFGNPASQAITPNLVPKDHFANAVTWYSSVWQLAVVTGPAIGGFLYFFGPNVIFFASTAAFFLCALCAHMLRTPLDPSPGGKGPVTWETLSAGLRFIWSRQVVFGAIALDLVAVMFGGVTALLPIVAKDILHVGPTGLGILRSSPAIGAVVMGLLIARLPVQSKAGSKMLIAVGIYGMAAVLFGLSPWFILSVICLIVMGASDQVSVVIRHTMVQSDTPDEMRGRVAAVNSIFVSGSADMGEFRAGMSAALFGVGNAILIGGVCTIFFAAAWAKFFPQLAARDKLVQ
ncbi:MAG: MFS transporter [Beijerinckiaceae bacterium]|nr:MFS transporter [Beijerinckiaceae bacterium]